MPRPLRILIVEDSPLDAELLVMALRRAGFEPAWHRVESEAEFLEQLDDRLEVVFSDCTLPQFNALRALSLLQARGLAVPFIIVSGTISDDIVTLALQHGAADCLLKDDLANLGKSVTRALASRPDG
jgi:CheY-like chemotaxis protein